MTDTTPFLSTPKRSGHSASGKAAWYAYYAGFSPRFVRDVLGVLALREHSIICDPWNGAGTTTQVAHDLGYSAFGYDLNPAMVMVAKARLLGAHTAPSHAVLCSHIVRKASQYCAPVLEPDPLSVWFTPRSARFVRNIERAVQHLLVDDGDYVSLATRGDLGRVSSLAAFFYVALFRTVRQLLTKFGTTNPTWLKFPSNPAERLRPTSAQVRTAFRKQVAAMTGWLCDVPPLANGSPRDGEHVEIKVADSRSLPLAPNSVDAMIGSPPYCTRIDYIVATRPELALLGFNGEALREMRNRTIGTTSISKGTNQKRGRESF